MASEVKDVSILAMDIYFPPNCVLQVDLHAGDDLLRGTDQNVTAVAAGMELGTNYMPHGLAAKPTFDEHGGDREIDGFWGYMLQIIYQVEVLIQNQMQQQQPPFMTQFRHNR